jgi:hypothetical protein
MARGYRQDSARRRVTRSGRPKRVYQLSPAVLRTAEGEGFEPSVTLTRHDSFQERARIRHRPGTSPHRARPIPYISHRPFSTAPPTRRWTTGQEPRYERGTTVLQVRATSRAACRNPRSGRHLPSFNSAASSPRSRVSPYSSTCSRSTESMPGAPLLQRTVQRGGALLTCSDGPETCMVVRCCLVRCHAVRHLL